MTSGYTLRQTWKQSHDFTELEKEEEEEEKEEVTPEEADSLSIKCSPLNCK